MSVIAPERVMEAASAAVAAVAVALALASFASASIADRLTRAAGLEVTCSTTVPGLPAEGQTPSGMYLDGRVWLRQDKCSRIEATLTGRTAKGGVKLTRQGLAWLTLAHEVAHHNGYDHGETTTGAECAGYRLFVRPLMRNAGVRQPYVVRLTKAIRTTGPCIPWTVAP